MALKYKVIRSKRRTVALIVKADGSLEVKVPLVYSAKSVDVFVQQKSAWVQKVLDKRSTTVALNNYTEETFENIRRLTSAKVDLFLQTYPGKKPQLVKIRKQKSVWGTCNSKGIISINALAGILPTPLFEYIMIHELTHLEVLNHSAYFWNLVSYYIPDWKERRTALKNYRISK